MTENRRQKTELLTSGICLLTSVLSLETEMSIMPSLVMATFTTPEKITANPQSILWLLPLVAAIAIVYKATKLPEIKSANFLKEAVLLSGSIIVFMFITALALCALAWLVTE